MKFSLVHKLILMIITCIIIPLGVMADDLRLKLNVQDVFAFKGEKTELKVEIIGGVSPYKVLWFDGHNNRVTSNSAPTFSQVDSACVFALETEDFLVRVEDSRGEVVSDVLRLFVRDYKSVPAYFENLPFPNDNYYTPLYTRTNLHESEDWKKSFVSGSFVFSSKADKLENKHTSGFIATNISRSTKVCSNDLNYLSVSGNGINCSTVYSVVSDSAYVTFATDKDMHRPVQGFYISNSSYTKKYLTELRKSIKKDECIYVTITNVTNGKSLDFYLADYRSKHKNDWYCLNNWQWVDIRSLDFKSGSLKLKLNCNLKRKKGLSLPHTFCIDDFNGKCFSTDVSPQMVGVESKIDLKKIILAPDNNAETTYSIFNVEGGYPENSSFTIDEDANLLVSAPYCNVRVTIKVLNKGSARYVTVPVVVDGDVKSADFEESIANVSNNTEKGVLRSGSYVFSKDDDIRSAFRIADIESDSLQADSLLQQLSTSKIAGSSAFSIMSNSGYIYNMCHDAVIPGFYVKPTHSTYNSIIRGSGIGQPYHQGDSLILTICNPVNNKKVEFPLADYRSDNKSDHYCHNSWQWIDLRSLGKTNVLHLYLSGSRFSENEIVPECMIDNFAGSPELVDLPSATIYADTTGVAEFHLDNCFDSITDCNTDVKYELESVNSDEFTGCVKITGDKLYCVAAHTDSMNVVLKTTFKERTQYFSLPIKVINDNDTVITNTTVTSSNQPATSNAEREGSTYNNIDKVRPDKKQGGIEEKAKLQNPVKTSKKKIPPRGSTESRLLDEGSLRQPQDIDSQTTNVTDSLALKSENDTSGVSEETVIKNNGGEETNKKEIATLEESTDMRIIYTMLFLFVLALALMYVYMKRQGKRNEVELESLKKRYAESIAMYDKAKDEIASLAALKQKYAEVIANYEKAQKEIESLSVIKQNYAEAKANYEKAQKEIESLSVIKQKYAEAVADYEKSQKEIESLSVMKQKYAEVQANYEKAQKELESLSALKQKYADVVANYEKAQGEIDSLSEMKHKYAEALANYENAQKEIETLSDLKQKYAEVISNYEKAQVDIEALSEIKQKYDEAKANYEKAQSEIEALAGMQQKYAEASEKCGLLENEIQRLVILNNKYLEEIEKNKSENLEDTDIENLKKEYSEALAEAKKDIETVKQDLGKKLGEKEYEICRLKTILSSYQDNVNPDEWNAEQSLLEHETVVQLHRDVDGAHMASERQWNDLSGVISKLLPDFFTTLSLYHKILSDNEFKVCMLTRLKFLPTEMAVLLNLSKQRITNIRAAVNKKLFDETGTKTFENNIFNLGNK